MLHDVLSEWKGSYVDIHVNPCIIAGADLVWNIAESEQNITNTVILTPIQGRKVTYMRVSSFMILMTVLGGKAGKS